MVLQALSVYPSLHEKLSQMAPSSGKHQSQNRHGHSRHGQRLHIGCWNMRTLVEAEGSIATSVVRPSSRGVTVDRKATLMVQELKRFRMNVTGISETKRFGQVVYEVKGYTILHSGCPIPGESQTAERNEGVGIVLDPQMTTAWKEADEIWKAVGSRIVRHKVRQDLKEIQCC